MGYVLSTRDCSGSIFYMMNNTMNADLVLNLLSTLPVNNRLTFKYFPLKGGKIKYYDVELIEVYSLGEREGGCLRAYKLEKGERVGIRSFRTRNMVDVAY